MAKLALHNRLRTELGCRIVLLIAVAAFGSARSLGEWTKTIRCAPGQIYRDVRQNAGREEFCERLLPGSLVVKDGPYRFWFSEGHTGSQGDYLNGREVGTWKECDRFDRCQQLIHEAVFKEENRRPAFTPNVPVQYEAGKYVFDFASCRTTWVTQSNGSDPISLNIGGTPYRCDITYMPESVMRHGGMGDYLCRIPFAVGRRAFDSIDLRSEFPRAGLPQFCRPVDRMGEPLLIQKGTTEVATTVDVTCARLEYSAPNKALLELQLNPFARDLVMQTASGEDPLNTLLCLQPVSRRDHFGEPSGPAGFIYTIRAHPYEYAKLKACLARFQAQSCR